MQKEAYFRFYAELNDFLPKEKRQQRFEFSFSGSPAIKDSIEAIGVPHPEVDLVLVNGASITFDYRLKDKDEVSVYPVFELLNISEINHLRPKPLRITKFITDVNLGKLAKKLRLLGFDTALVGQVSEDEIVQNAVTEKRIILTRNAGLLKIKTVTHGYWVRSTEPVRQVAEVTHKFDLIENIKPFSRCSVCNGRIEQVEKSLVEHEIPPMTSKHFNEFYQCQSCKHVYWKGSHYKKISLFIANLESQKSTDELEPA